MTTEVSPYYTKLSDLLDPFLNAASFAKQLGNISVRTPQFDIGRLYSIIEEEVDELLNEELSRHPHKSRLEEMAIIVADMRYIMHS